MTGAGKEIDRMGEEVKVLESTNESKEVTFVKNMYDPRRVPAPTDLFRNVKKKNNPLSESIHKTKVKILRNLSF